MEGGGEPLVREERRVDASREVPQILQGAAGLRLDLGEKLHDLLRVAIGQLAREPRLHRERDQLLLGAVVDVALESPALLVLGRDQAPAGSAQILHEADVP